MRKSVVAFVDRFARLLVVVTLLITATGWSASTSTAHAQSGSPTPPVGVTATVAASDSPTPTGTGAATPSEAPTLTPSVVLTETASATPTPTLTETPNVAVTETTTITPTPTIILTPTETITITVTPTLTATATLTVTTTLTPTQMLTPTATVVTPGDDETIVTPGEGGELKSKDGKVKVKFPKDSITENVHVKYKAKKAPDQVQAEAVALQHVFDLDATGAGNKKVDQFQKAVTIMVDLTGMIQFPLPRGQQLWLGYLDDKKNEWVRSDFVLRKTEAGQLLVEAETNHFSTWGFGRTLDAGWLPMFNEPQVALFSGASTFNYPIEVPPGRGGVQPQLNLSYNSRQIDGMLTWTQSGWVGNGFDLDLPSISRDFTDSAATGDFAPGTLPFGNYASCEGRIRLQFNGIGYLLVPGAQTATGFRYYTQEDSQLYIERRNWAMGDTTSANTTGEYWIVRDPRGVEYRMGFLTASEFVLNHASRCLYGVGQQTDVNYGGKDSSKVAVQWRVDRVTDLNTTAGVSNNSMDITYDEEARCGGGVASKATYLSTISYNKKTDGTWGTVIYFDRLDRPNGYEGHSACDKLTHQNQYLSGIRIYQNGGLVRRYELGYEIQANSGGANTRLLNLVRLYGTDNITALPATIFLYSAGMANRGWDGRCANPGDPYWNGGGGNYSYDCEIFTYKRLQEVRNGYGGRTVFSYADDGRGYYSFHNYRVTIRDVYDGMNASAARTEYAYDYACYNQNGGGGFWAAAGQIAHSADCPAPWPAGIQGSGPLSGYGIVTETKRDYNSSVLAITTHYFWTTGWSNRLVGREYKTEMKNPAGTILSINETEYGVRDSGANRWLIAPSVVYNRTPDGAGYYQNTRMSYGYDYYGSVSREYHYGAEARVNNPGFETGLDYWASFNFAGSISVSLVNGQGFGTGGSSPNNVVALQGPAGSDGGVWSDVTLAPGATYTLRAWVYASAGNTARFFMYMQDTNGANKIYSTQVTPGTGWQQVAMNYAVSGSTPNPIRIHLRYQSSAGQSGTIYIDEIAIARQQDVGDERATYRWYFNEPNGKWLVGLKWGENTFDGIVANACRTELKQQKIWFYDGYADPATPGSAAQISQITKGLVTMQGQGTWCSPARAVC